MPSSRGGRAPGRQSQLRGGWELPEGRLTQPVALMPGFSSIDCRWPVISHKAIRLGKHHVTDSVGHRKPRVNQFSGQCQPAPAQPSGQPWGWAASLYQFGRNGAQKN